MEESIVSLAPPAEILCLSNEPIAGALSRICGHLGLIPYVLTDPQELDTLNRKFPLAIVNANGQSHSPFSFKSLPNLISPTASGLSVERLLALDALDDLWGNQIYYSYSCSGYCRIDLDSDRNLTSADIERVTAVVKDVLSMAPYEPANYYEYVSDELLHSVVESSLAPLVVFLKDRNVWFANLAAQALFKRPTHLMKGLPVEELFASDDVREQFWDFVKRVMQKPGDSAEFRMRARNGDEFDALLTANQIFDARLPLESIGFTLHDITQRKALESRLHQSQKMEVVGQLAGGIAHDFNNILTGILGNLSLAQMEDDIDQIKATLAKAEQASLRAAGLVKQLLDFSRRSRVDIKPLRLPPVVREVTGIVRSLIDRRIEIVIDEGKRLPLILADAGQMHQVVLNLCVNARDAVEQAIQQGICTSPRIAIRMESEKIGDEYCRTHNDAVPGWYVRLSVSDNGVGMDDATLKRIFEPFFTTKSVGKGSGLGLSTIYGIVNQHHGWTEVASEIGRGTTFNIYLPAASETAPEVAQPEQDQSVPRGKETILLIDDEEVIRDLGRALLGRLGYSVLTAFDGLDGLDLFTKERGRIDLIILDISMPIMSGREVLTKIKAMDPAMKVIMSSGYDMEQKSSDFGKLDAAGFLAKPYCLSDIAQKVRGVLDKV